ncbi:adenylate/guanylate cyclase catalytic domain protein [Leptospira ryugenii]|uniref:Adenylate/guanylate cyclase catalytic domain protein n=1 Tax=Leptospira ryugenii TaxID=1917863 RepID=A0A2P2E571_9LEPT|nr:adenylate/guanylate cyclase domain-containing protein [Leptospira ryugenii]GBF52018.1 adenylate/guanylate cyclase catalytic domain protein [Leptospira ryugenii]
MTISTLLESIKKCVRISQQIWNILSSGIRAKLAWFTGSLIALTIILLSFLTVRQQTEILTESYEKQASISRNFIAGLVLEIEGISQNLIRIEEFRNRINKQREELKKYRTKSEVIEEKTVSLFGFKTKLFGVLGKEKVTKQEETFFSSYLTEGEVRYLEQKTREQINKAGKHPLAESQWLELQNLAKQYVSSESASIQTLQKKDQTKDKLNPTQILKLDETARQFQKQARFAKSKLDLKISQIFAANKKRKLEELGLDTRLFRIQIFPLLKGSSDSVWEVSFDTRILDPEAQLSLWKHDPKLDKHLETSSRKILKSLGEWEEDASIGFEWKSREIQALHAPLFRNPASTKRAENLIKNKFKLSKFASLRKEDEEITEKIKTLIPQIRNRIQSLKKAKPPIPPFQDRAFNQLYQNYDELIQKRNQNFDLIALESNISEANLENFEFLRSLRDSTLEDWVTLKFKAEQTDYESYYANDEERDKIRYRWQAIRNWIKEAKSETPKPELKKLFPDSSIAHSRSEAEEIMWKIDSLHLYGSDSNSLGPVILKENISGIIRTLVDRTDGIHAIKSNRNQVVLTAVSICLFAVLLAIFISGVVVQKIKRIIKSAEDVGKGNLNVIFTHGGNDEFGNLTVALNEMVSGLRDREKMRGILGSMIDPVVVGEAMKDLSALKRGSEKNITAFFSDIAGFSFISEKLKAYELANLLNEYLSAMTAILKEYDGVLDKYIGDAIVGIFNAPVDVEDHCTKAVLASLAMQKKMEELKAHWKAKNLYIPEVYQMSFRIGLNTGLSKVGFMGTDAISAYTMMGDTVNLAARLEAAAKDYGVKILASESVYQIVNDRIFTRKLDLVRVKGKANTVVLYEIICPLGEESEQERQFVHQYEEALFSYINQYFDEAIKRLEKAMIDANRKDIASIQLIGRCKEYLENPPGNNWDGVFTRTHK